MQLTNIGKQTYTLAASGVCHGARGVAKLGSSTVSVMTKSVSFIGSSIAKIGCVALGALKSIGSGLVAGVKHLPKNKYTLIAFGAAAATAIYAKKFFKKAEAKADEAKPEAEKTEVAQAKPEAEKAEVLAAAEEQASEEEEVEGAKTASIDSADENSSVHSEQAANDA